MEKEDAAGPSRRDALCSHEMQSVCEVGTDAGIVESISLKNFMCHSLLGPFNFGSNVNFVVGNNGSGKSAVLTALIVALGGKAQATSRGSSLRCFVKEGESSADVSVTLRNKGRYAYKPEVYGDSIIIDLRITREGNRSYKLRSKTGQLVSAKKEELVSILERFHIQVNNPVSILTQEMSKHFLHSKGEGDKYRFFMKATQLEQMKEDYIHSKETKHVAMAKVEQHAEVLKDLKRKVQEKEERFNSLESLDNMNAKLEELQKQMAWALVTEMEKELLPLQEKLQSDKRCTEKYNEKVEEWKNKVVEAENKYKQIHEQLENITLRVQELLPQCAQLKAEAQRRNARHKSSEVSVHRCKTNLRDLEKDKTQLSSRINELKLRLTNGQRTSVAKAIQICSERLTVDRTPRSLDTEISRLSFKITTQQDQQGDRLEIMRQYREAVGKYKDVAQQVETLNDSIKTLDSINNDSLKLLAELRRFLSYRCQCYFNSMLHQRGFTGSMKFDHKRETLSISVQQASGANADMSDMRSLSGGERSFSTVCFVLALWAVTEAPFRCLDEFDVYMDMVNRKIATGMMLKVATTQRFRQFIFITPQSMSSLPVSKYINILRLKDPARGGNDEEEEQE
ncbi:structural maintenance of chromosomes protein 6-like [Diretmus argenteus]